MVGRGSLRNRPFGHLNGQASAQIFDFFRSWNHRFQCQLRYVRSTYIVRTLHK
jgi:hypothetical protein